LLHGRLWPQSEPEALDAGVVTPAETIYLPRK
jgi:hypothetical protein